MARCALQWCWTGLSAGAGALYVVGLIGGVNLPFGTDARIWITDGGLWISWLAIDDRYDWFGVEGWPTTFNPSHHVKWSFDRWTGGLDRAVFVPLWLPLVGTALLTARAWQRRRRPGECNNCGYDLAGIPSNVCPECGEKVHDLIPDP